MVNSFDFETASKAASVPWVLIAFPVPLRTSWAFNQNTGRITSELKASTNMTNRSGQ